MTPTFIASPFAAVTAEQRERNDVYLRACMLDSMRRGEAFYAPHALYTKLLDDNLHEERELSLRMGLAWLAKAHKLVLYMDLGKTSGMASEEAFARRAGIPVEERTLGGEWLL